MPLFGPNIKKMKEKGDIAGLAEALKDRDPETRAVAGEALKEIGDANALQALANVLINTLKYGTDDDKMEATAMMQGHGTSFFWLSSKLRAKLRRRVPLDLVRSPLVEAAEKDTYPLVRWHALIALAELGERNDKIVGQIVEFGNGLLTALSDHGLIAYGIRTETLRALSFFRDDSAAADALIKAAQGSQLAWKGADKPPFKDDFYALGALGHSSTREFIEFWAGRGQEGPDKRAAKASLEMFGKASYDEIATRAESP